MIEIIIKVWPLIFAAIAGIIWLIRLEAIVKETNRRQDNIEKNQENAIAQINKSLSKLESLHEKTDIKISELTLNVAKIVAYEDGKKSINRGRTK